MLTTANKTTQNRRAASTLVLRLLVVAFFFNSIAPVLATQSVTGNRLLLCTSQGYQWVTLDSQSTEPNQPELHCVLCLSSDDDDLAAIIGHTVSLGLPATREQPSWTGKVSAFGHDSALLPDGRAPPTIDNDNNLKFVSL